VEALARALPTSLMELILSSSCSLDLWPSLSVWACAALGVACSGRFWVSDLGVARMR
jgi:hypothetical protein